MPMPDQSLRQRDAFLDAAHDLVLEYHGLPAGSVLRCLARAYREARLAVHRGADSEADLLEAAVGAAHARLDVRSASAAVRRSVRAAAWSRTAVSA